MKFCLFLSQFLDELQNIFMNIKIIWMRASLDLMSLFEFFFVDVVL